jgi:hypothetical protein
MIFATILSSKAELSYLHIHVDIRTREAAFQSFLRRAGIVILVGLSIRNYNQYYRVSTTILNLH